MSSTLTSDEATWGSTTVLAGNAIEEVSELSDRSGGDLLVEGSAQLVHGLARHGLVDEYRLMMFPVVLGGGKRVFPEDMPAPARLTLVDSKAVGSACCCSSVIQTTTDVGEEDPMPCTTSV
ncbi:MAG: dihydrofolate reductase family protein [Acidimicrobiales bacterium]